LLRVVGTSFDAGQKRQGAGCACQSAAGTAHFFLTGIGHAEPPLGRNVQDADRIDMQHVPYKGSAQALGDVIGGQIALTFENITVASTQVKSGRVRDSP